MGDFFLSIETVYSKSWSVLCVVAQMRFVAVLAVLDVGARSGLEFSQWTGICTKAVRESELGWDRHQEPKQAVLSQSL